MNKKRLAPVMFAGTGSDVGKSVIATGFCRIFKQDGYEPAPFKAQNMALNSFATPDGLEIGRAQAVQAEAAGIPCCTDMNPLLLKPNSDHTSQVVLNGKPYGNQSAYAYFRKEGRDVLRREVHAAFDRLKARYNPIVMEGAGSVAEINLRETDLVNMPMAIYAGANVILVADIERGGVFASVYGSIMLMTPQERSCVKGILINKFRGDSRLFESGRKQIEQLCGVPVLGVLPYFKDIHIEEEDSVALSGKNTAACDNKVNIAVILLRHISNFTDFNVLERDSRVHLFYTNNINEIKRADIIIVPGSKSTIADLAELRKNGVAAAIINAHKEGATVLGICGGYQIMGEEVLDPNHIEGEIERLPGLGLLPVSTTISCEKITRQSGFCTLPLEDKEQNDGRSETTNSSEMKSHSETTNSLEMVSRSEAISRSETTNSSEIMNGYEIHMGETFPVEGCTNFMPLNRIDDGRSDGCFVSRKCMGTYIHGILDNQRFADWLIEPYFAGLSAEPFDYKAYKEEQYNKLAAEIRKHVDMDKIYKILESND